MPVKNIGVVEKYYLNIPLFCKIDIIGERRKTSWAVSCAKQSFLQV
jgi:hypothetical protein